MLITFSEDLNVSFYHNFSVEVHYMQFYFITFLLLTSVTQRSCDTTIWWLINQYRQGNKLKHSVWTFTLWALTSPLLKTNFLSLLLTRQRIVLLAEGSRRAVNHVCHEYCLRRGTQEQKIIFAGQIFSCVLKSIARFGKMLRAKLRLTFVQILWLFGILTLVNCNGKLKLVHIYIQDDVTDVFYVFKYSIVRCEKFKLNFQYISNFI